MTQNTNSISLQYLSNYFYINCPQSFTVIIFQKSFKIFYRRWNKMFIIDIQNNVLKFMRDNSRHDGGLVN